MKARYALIAIMLLAFGATAAQATVYDFTDNTEHWADWANGTSDDYKDVIGVPNFKTGTITYDQNIMTGFSTSFTAGSNYNQLNSGNLFINIDDDDSWDYVIDLNGRAGGTVNVYEFNAAYDDANAYDMSYSSSGYRQDHPIAADDSYLGALVDTASWSGLPTWHHCSGELTTYITGLDIEFEMLTWGYTVSCANDVIFEGGLNATPIPGAVWLLGSGLLGLLRWRRKATA